MERNTLTQLGDLGKGDRFTYPGKKDVWQVMATAASNAFINQVENGISRHKYDTPKANKTPVVFLRHTIPQPNTTVLVEQLQPDNVFTLENNIVTEYFVREQFTDLTANECKAVQVGTHNITFIPHGTSVVYISQSWRQ